MSPHLQAVGWPTIYSVAILFTVWVSKQLFFTKRKLPLPPGPKGLPIVGNIRDLPPRGIVEWEHWLPHKDLYGPISSVTVLGTTLVLIHDPAIALELLEKRSAKYSSRPRLVFASELCGYDQLLSFQRHDDNFRAQRRLMAGQMGSKSSMTKFQSAIELQVRRFLLRAVRDNDELIRSLEAEAGSLMLDTLYGYASSSQGRDPLIDLVNKVMHDFGIATMPGAWLVDVMPWLQYLPDWVPGTGFKQIARGYRKTFGAVIRIPHAFTERQIADGAVKTSIVSNLLNDSTNEQEKHLIKFAATALYGGGADTSVAALSCFFVAMSVFPEVQRKSREEIDRVVGSGRLPSFQDRGSLPYVDAVVKEVLRWQPITPLCLAHSTDVDDEFRGYHIPKGAVIIPAVAWFLTNPEVYHEPELFKPERFLGPDPEPNPSIHIFGYGRRICPGRHLADANIFLTIAQSLASLDIGKAIDEETGKVINPLLGPEPGIIAHPKPFRCQIAPRSEKHAEWIQSIEVEHPWGDGDAQLLRGLD